ncbi:retrovirus-related Pol polyprotein from type-1 retrotransposable element R2 [Caerostris darwini]|uniref:Retrovirus-related Pol polyprotein from type-1 retrotransposable element R2 n=1 Tax=Caerostris darwini TaxID=1538125 RepID=A0AAV4PKZ2_9ARAC|nr:retrovirus-related Pol polyprotein from type-1 retrotransposable element R2 [Caerostris darwini]
MITLHKYFHTFVSIIIFFHLLKLIVYIIPAASRTFFQDEDAIDPIQLCLSPRGILFDELSPPAPSSTFFEAEELVSGPPHPGSPSPPQRLDASPDCSIHVVDAPQTAEVDLYPSDTEVKDLFSEHSSSPRFDFLKLACLPCHRKFFSAGGLENHMFAVHDVLVQSASDTHVPADNCTLKVQSSRKSSPPELLSFGPMTGPPKRPPFSSIAPAKTWASVVAKSAVSSSQPGSGRRVDFASSVSTTPRRPVCSRPSRPSVASQPSQQVKNTSSRQATSSMKHPKISFSALATSPDDVSHVVLLPQKGNKKKRKLIPCPRCDFTFRTLTSRDEHLTVHSLEDEFNRLHGIVNNASLADFDDFVLPKSPRPKSLLKKARPAADQESASTSSARRNHPLAPASAASTSLACAVCDKRGFPSRKALRYHLFRLHGQPMQKTSKHSQSTTSFHAQDSTSPVSANSTTPSVVRQDATLELSFPINGKIACPEIGCSASFVSGVWNTMKGSLIKHLRFVHRISIAVCQFKCDICHLDITGKPREHPCFAELGNPLVLEVQQSLVCSLCPASFSSTLGLQNHEKSHLKTEAMSHLPALVLPPSRRRKRAKKVRAVASPSSDVDHQQITDVTQVLAPPPDDDQVVDSIPPSPEHEGEPLHHFVRMIDEMLECEPSADGVELLSETFSQIVVEAKNIVLPNSPQASSSSFQAVNVDDPQQIQKLYRRNRRRAIREIRGAQGERCAIPPSIIEEHFSSIWQESSSAESFYSTLHPDRDEVLGTLLSVSEVVSAFKTCENTAPGPDRLTYNHWRSLDPRALLLTKLFNWCIHLRTIPRSWRESTTILLPKSGDASCPSNWRPIALSCTAYKLFMKCLTARLQNWCTKHEVLSPAQKGFTPFDGVMEHNFVLQRRMEKARASRSNLCLAFLDISNAFGSLPHSAIRDCLAAIGVGQTFLDLVVEAYSHCTTSILTNDACTASIPIKCGVKQGCPLSGLIFNLCIDPVIRAIQGMLPNTSFWRLRMTWCFWRTLRPNFKPTSIMSSIPSPSLLCS